MARMVCSAGKRGSIACLFLLLLVAAQAAWAGTTGKIAGKVTDAKSREPLIGVNVLVAGTSMGASTNVRGEYVIANVPPGTYSVRASQVGFTNVTVNNVSVRTDATTEINLRMEEQAVVGEEVVITAERPVIQKDNTASRVYIERQEVVSRPTNVLTEVLNTLPSINNENGNITVRGGSLNEVSFIIDGARVRNPMTQTPYTTLNLSAVQDMEIITGSFNAEYGEARSGVFNIVTKEGGEKVHAFADLRFTPPGVRHWGPSIYDESTPVYWENTHARHLQWWIQYPDQWVDPNGVPGNDPRSIWTPEQAYANYMATHQPLTDYTTTPSYSGEFALNGPIPGVDNLFFAVTGKYQYLAPLIGNSFLKHGSTFDGTAKLTYRLGANTKLLFSGIMNSDKTAWGIWDNIDNFYFRNYGLTGRYSYYDTPGLPYTAINMQTLKLDHVISQGSLLEVKLIRNYSRYQDDIFPGDPLGFTPLSDPQRDQLRSGYTGGGNANPIGYHIQGYQSRYDDKLTEWDANAFYQNQVSTNWELKTGLDFTYYYLNHFNEALFPARTDQNIYKPWQGAAWFQNKLEFGGFIMNAGLRLDFYNPNSTVYTDLFFNDTATTEKSKVFTQISPRLGISHPIDENTILRFSYGHFFERGPFGDFGEETGNNAGSLTTFIINGTSVPTVLGNRLLKPEKTIQYEVGIERNFFDMFLLNVSGYYKDIRNTIRDIIVDAPEGVYHTTGNGNYGDVKGFEVSLRKQYNKADWGTTTAYLNFNSQIRVYGLSGDPIAYSYQTGVTLPNSGDAIYHTDPQLKAGFFYQTPSDWGFLGGVLSDLSLTFDYVAIFANDMNPGDRTIVKGIPYTRPTDQNMNLRIRKDVVLMNNTFRIGVYAEIHNLFNNQWVYLPAFDYATDEERQKMVDSNFKYKPGFQADGTPILELTMFRNLPRSVIFGLTMDL